MSHDRGCYKCGRDNWDYDNCQDSDCAKALWRKAFSPTLPSLDGIIWNPGTTRMMTTSQENPTKICKNCKHYMEKPNLSKYNRHVCIRRLGKKVNVVTGETAMAGYESSCEEERGLKNTRDSATVVQDTCGPAGIYYVAKENTNAASTQESSQKGKTKSRKQKTKK